METPEEAGTHLNKLHEAVWQLAAITLALRDPATADPDLRWAAGQVVAATGLGSSDVRALRLGPGLAQLIELQGGDPTKLASQTAAPVCKRRPSSLAPPIGRAKTTTPSWRKDVPARKAPVRSRCLRFR
jgi:hypothetical protein